MLNDMLIALYDKILRVEEDFLRGGSGDGISIREMHTIEYIGKSGSKGRTLSDIAGFLEVARPSVTVAVRKLEQKGMLIKSGCAMDGRVVRVTLTREGRRAYMHHMRFHALMVSELDSELGDDEKNTLINAISKLDRFFEKSIEATR